jgi:hypothetical protein
MVWCLPVPMIRKLYLPQRAAGGLSLRASVPHVSLSFLLSLSMNRCGAVRYTAASLPPLCMVSPLCNG